LNECNAPVSYAFECNRVGSRDAQHHSKFVLYHLYHLLSAFDITLHEVMAANVAKLRARYPGEGWTAADAAERKDDGMTDRAQRRAELESERVKAYRAGLLRAAEECEGYAAVVADEYDDGPHSVHADVARHLARELREIADRDAPAAQPDPPPSAQAVSNRLRAMLDEAMAEYPSLRARFAKGLKEIGGSDG